MYREATHDARMVGSSCVGGMPGDDTKLLLEEVSVPCEQQIHVWFTRFTEHDGGLGWNMGIYIYTLYIYIYTYLYIYICVCIKNETPLE